MVAGVDLDLIAREVSQVGNDGGFLCVDDDHGLGVFLTLILIVGDGRGPWWAGGGGEEGQRPVGDAHYSAPLS